MQVFWEIMVSLSPEDSRTRLGQVRPNIFCFSDKLGVKVGHRGSPGRTINKN